MIRVVHPGSGTPNPDPDFLPIPDPGVKKAPDPESPIRIRNTGNDPDLMASELEYFVVSVRIKINSFKWDGEILSFSFPRLRYSELRFTYLSRNMRRVRRLPPNEPNPFGTKGIFFISYWIDFVILALM